MIFAATDPVVAFSAAGAFVSAFVFGGFSSYKTWRVSKTVNNVDSGVIDIGQAVNHQPHDKPTIYRLTELNVMASKAAKDAALEAKEAAKQVALDAKEEVRAFRQETSAQIAQVLGAVSNMRRRQDDADTVLAKLQASEIERLQERLAQKSPEEGK